jgi:hypothetical protein
VSSRRGGDLLDDSRVDVEHPRKQPVAAGEPQRDLGAGLDRLLGAVEERGALARTLVALVVGVEGVDGVLDLGPQRAGGLSGSKWMIRATVSGSSSPAPRT